jgi:DNA-directed RNA polymerase specialized sigma subunit
MKITAKAQHYLRSAWYYEKKSTFLTDKIAVLRSKAEKITTSYQDAPSFGGFEDHKQQIIADMVDLEREYKKTHQQCRNKLQEIAFFINQLESFQERIVLQMRYLYFENWQDIALRLNYEERQIYRIHGRGLVNLIGIHENIIKNGGKPLF